MGRYHINRDLQIKEDIIHYRDGLEYYKKHYETTMKLLKNEGEEEQLIPHEMAMNQLSYDLYFWSDCYIPIDQ
jgi:hypothetical protein